eukprot:m.20763 g.20763  ORF g.20763 m.20763 type:complete len:523 (-) comp6945_c0_seq1:1408-2976(-)
MGQGKKDSDSDEDINVTVQIDSNKKKKNKSNKKKRRSTVTAIHASATSTDNDGVNVIGRIGIVFGTVSLGLFLMALISPEWTIADNLGSGSLLTESNYAMSRISKGTFGMWRYCLSTEVEKMNNATRSICFLGYGDQYELHGTFNNTARNSEDQDACQHFKGAKICERRYFIQWVTIILVVFMIMADIYSEKLIINAIGCALGALAGAACMGFWMNVFNDLKDQTDGEVKHGIGFALMAGGFVAALLGAVCSTIDLVCINTERFGCMNDGTQLIGRAGMLMGALVWILYLTSLFLDNWAVTTNLGDEVHFAEVGLDDVDGARWGLFHYCLELSVLAFGDEFKYVCMSASEQVQFLSRADEASPDGTIPSLDGCEIFDKVNYCERSKFVIVALIIAVVIVFISDIFSEKLSVNAMVMGLATIGGVAAAVQWLLFVFHISGPKNYGAAAKVRVGGAFFAVLIGVGLSFISCILNYLDFIDKCQCSFEQNAYQEGKSSKDTGDCDCFICFGDGTSGYDGVNDSKA